MRLSKYVKLRNVWWLILVFAGAVFLCTRYSKIYTGEAYWFDGFVFVVWVALLISPLFEQINLMGVSLKQKIDSFKKDLDQQLAMIRTDMKSINITSINQKFTVGSSSPESKVPAGGQATEEKKSVANVSGLRNVAEKKPVSYIARRIFLTSGSEWDRDQFHIHYSIDQGKYPSNLTDGNRDTLAYPASWFFDYVIDLLRPYDVEKVNLVWGSFGKEKDYITQWNLYAQERLPGKDRLYPQSEWRLVDSGGFPNAEKTPIPIDKKVRARRFRIVAESLDVKNNSLLNWIGMAEFEAYAQDKGP